MNETQVPHASHATRPAGGAARVTPLERENAELRRENAHLQHRLEESELRADFRMRADRLLAIPLPGSR